MSSIMAQKKPIYLANLPGRHPSGMSCRWALVWLCLSGPVQPGLGAVLLEKDIFGNKPDESYYCTGIS